MDVERIRDRCRVLIDELYLPSTVDTRVLAAWLSEDRGRPLHLLAHPDLGEPSGVGIASDRADHVFYDAALTGVYRDHVVTHELAHIAFEHGREEVLVPEVAAALLPDVDRRSIRTMLTHVSYIDVKDKEAEVLASMLLQLPPGKDVDNGSDRLGPEARGMALGFGSRSAPRR